MTERIRNELKSSGTLVREEKEFQVFDSLSWTEAQKRDARQYGPGMALRFHRKKDGFAWGETVEVIEVGTARLTLRRPDGSTGEFKLGRGPASFEAGEFRTLRVAAGDKLLLQANAVTARRHFINGELVEVKAVQGGAILLTDGRVVPEDYRAFTHGYAVTSHAAQGKTADEVLVVASSRSLPAVYQQQFYVSISRGREHCRIFTDDKELLRSLGGAGRIPRAEGHRPNAPRGSRRLFPETIRGQAREKTFARLERFGVRRSRSARAGIAGGYPAGLRRWVG